MLDDGWSALLWPPGELRPGDDRSPPAGLPPEAPLAMPPQRLERRRRRGGLWRRLLVRSRR